MSRFMARIAVDPQGYRWDGEFEPDEGDNFLDGTYLEGIGEAEVRKRLHEDGLFSYENSYDPFVTEPALFRIFAGLQKTPEAILAFANQYGDFKDLWAIHEGVDYTLRDWHEAIDDLRSSVELADKSIANQQKGRGVKASREDLHELVNSLVQGSEVFLSAGVKSESVTLEINARGLLDVIRLQLVEAITEKKRYRTCEQCGKPFEVMPQINRSDRIYCTDNCRVKAYQRRKREAIAMREAGSSLRAIVEATGTDIATIKRWVNEASTKEK